MTTVYDVAIIGGGINGCGCAADAASRGLSVVLLEKDDLASHTSSSSTKLIHGGLRYLEHYEFGLVKKALEERQTLLEIAPHLIHPLPFVLPHQKHMRPTWFLRLGLFLYDRLSIKNRLPKSISVKRNKHQLYFSPLKDQLESGLLFYDGFTDDSRLTLANALTAKEHGASIRRGSEVIHLEVLNNIWQLTVQPKVGNSYVIRAKSLINAAGPWVQHLAQKMSMPAKEMTLVKGSHIVVPKLYEGDQGYFLQHADKRVVFIIPYHGYSMIGTTDILFKDCPDTIQISQEEIEYLITLVNDYFTSQLHPDDVIHSWSGVRTLVAHETKNVTALSRDYFFEFTSKTAPCVTIYSGKMTTYRKLAEKVIDTLAPHLQNTASCSTSYKPLHGATLKGMDFKHYSQQAFNKYPWLDKQLINRYLLTYGTGMEKFLSGKTSPESLGMYFGSSLYQAEVDYLIAEEWALTSEDILKRRTKLYLDLDVQTRNTLDDYLQVAVL